MRATVSAQYPEPGPLPLPLPPRLRRVLAVLTEADVPLWTLDVARRAAMPFGTAYPLLTLLVERGWAVAHHTPPPSRRGPTRRCYRLTDTARTHAARILKETP